MLGMAGFRAESRTPTTLVALCVLALCLSFVSHGECQRTTTTPPTPISPPCSVYSNCDTCVQHSKCLWCITTNNCTDYPVSWLLPPPSLCQLSQARWGVCWFNFEALIITLGVLASILIISIFVCCCYCCFCCKKNQHRADLEEDRYVRNREIIRQRSEERKLDRKIRNDEIRRKYGLMGDADHPYSKFENE